MAEFTDTQSIYNAFKAASGSKEIWAVCQKLAQSLHELKKAKEKLSKAEESEESVDDIIAMFDDPKRKKAWMLKTLKTMAESGNASAAKQLQDALSILDNDKDIIYEVVHFDSICEGCERLTARFNTVGQVED